MYKTIILTSISATFFASIALAESQNQTVSDEVIAEQRAALKAATEGHGYGPQAPRDLDQPDGKNHRIFSPAPEVTAMELCDIHLHENAEHRGGQFTTYAGNGDGQGYGTGFKYDGELTEAELAPIDIVVGESENGDLQPGDTIEVHIAFSTTQATLGNSLGTCLSEAIGNPQLRVEAVVGVLVSEGGQDFTELMHFEEINGLNQVPNLPTDLGEPITYAGSTTGPGYNEKGSPYEVTWNVRPNVVKLNILSVNEWLNNNPFDEKHAHGVRTLVTNPDLLSQIN